MPACGPPFGGAQFGALVALIDDETITAAGGKQVLSEMLQDGGDPMQIVEKRGLKQVNDSNALSPTVANIIAANPDKASAYRNGKTGLLGFFIGQVMRETRGAANPQLVQTLVKERLAAEE